MYYYSVSTCNIITRRLHADDFEVYSRSRHLYSEQALYRRFHSPTILSDSFINKLVKVVDYPGNSALAAFDQQHMVGVARYGTLPQSPHIAEWAIIVADAYQGQGIGSLLLSQLLEHAKLGEIKVMLATFQCDNIPSQHLAAKVYGKPDHSTQNAGQLEWRWNISEL